MVHTFRYNKLIPKGLVIFKTAYPVEKFPRKFQGGLFTMLSSEGHFWWGISHFQLQEVGVGVGVGGICYCILISILVLLTHDPVK